MTEKLNPHELDSFLARNAVSVIHLDAPWDGYRALLQRQIESIAPAHEHQVSFGYVDVDEHPAYAESIGLKNVPACAYFKAGQLAATVIGIGQNIAGNIQIVRDDGTPDSSNVDCRR